MRPHLALLALLALTGCPPQPDTDTDPGTDGDTDPGTDGDTDPGTDGDTDPDTDTDVDLPDPVDVKINEIRSEQPGTDEDEYVELVAPPNTSLDGLTFIAIGDGDGGSGVIESITPLSGYTVGSSGYFVIAEDTFTMGTADLVVSDSAADGLKLEGGQNSTYLLVSGFSGAMDDDLDTNDDCVLDITPWAVVVDHVARIQEANGDGAPPAGTVCHYAATAADIAGPDGEYPPAHQYRCPDETGTWTIGNFDPADGGDTPGAANTCAQ